MGNSTIVPNHGDVSVDVIRHKCPQTRIVFLSQQTDGDIVEAALAVGGSAYVLKANARGDLQRAVEDVFHAAPAAVPSSD